MTDLGITSPILMFCHLLLPPPHTPTCLCSTLHSDFFNYAYILMMACFIPSYWGSVFGPASFKERICSDHRAIVTYLYKNSSALKIRRFALWNLFFYLSLPSHPLPISDAVLGFKLLSVSLNEEKDWCLFSPKATGPLCVLGLWHAQPLKWAE